MSNPLICGVSTSHYPSYLGSMKTNIWITRIAVNTICKIGVSIVNTFVINNCHFDRAASNISVPEIIGVDCSRRDI